LIYRDAAEEHHTQLSVSLSILMGYESMQEPASAVFFIHESG